MSTMTEKKFESFSEKDRMGRTLEGIAFWAHVQAPKYSERFKFHSYEISLQLDAKNQALAESYGLKVLPADKYIPGPYVRISRKVRTEKGQTAESTKPTIVDSVQNEVPAGTLVGNGSKVIVKFGTYWQNNTNAVGTTLFKVQILTLIPYEKGDKGLVNDPTGYRSASAANDGFEDAAIFDQA